MTLPVIGGALNKITGATLVSGHGSVGGIVREISGVTLVSTGYAKIGATLAKISTSTLNQSAINEDIGHVQGSSACGVAATGHSQINGKLRSTVSASCNGSNANISITSGFSGTASSDTIKAKVSLKRLAPQAQTLYDNSTGAIQGQLYGNVTNQSSAMSTVPGNYNAAAYYVNTGGGGPGAVPAPAARQPLGVTSNKTTLTANGTDYILFSNVPSGTTYTVDGGTSESAESPTMDFTATVAGTYTLDFSKFPALDSIFEIVAQ